jgi:hypothetical protein
MGIGVKHLGPIKTTMKRNSKTKVAYDKAFRAFMQKSVRLRLPIGTISILNHFFGHVANAMGGDDRPDHGLARMREGREHYRTPFLFLRHVLARAEKRMTRSQQNRALNLYNKMMEAEKAWNEEFQMKLKSRQRSQSR